ncbi:hypothetical protein [Caenibius sp. WL]|uniref:hypothetical protein n=1 Tax=Caenibius sp. WL TaxID=2872646 RepID=UPI001C98F72D|nr:hypothetical protein [Caenibius sp. WL]QZP08176.1 hypothetical protein K5X80_16340 [Caenibius sp. WL]
MATQGRFRLSVERVEGMAKMTMHNLKGDGNFFCINPISMSSAAFRHCGAYTLTKPANCGPERRMLAPLEPSGSPYYYPGKYCRYLER